MNEDLKTYGISLLEDTQLAMEPGISSEEVFTEIIMERISPLIDCEQPVIQHCVIKDKVGKVLGEIHGYAESTNEEVLYLFYTIYNPLTEILSKSNTDVQPAINRAQGFYKKATQAIYEDFDSYTPEYSALKYIYDNNHKYKSINIKLISNYILNNVDLKKITVTTKPVYLDVWDIRKLYGNTHSLSDHVAIDIDFDSDEYRKYKILYLQMESEQFGYKCVQALFPAKLIAKLYEKYNTNLLYNNVRYFLGLKGPKETKPNVAMLDTLRNENEMFLAYNNGITALAQGIEGIVNGEKTDVTDEENTASTQYVTMGQLKRILDFRVVNGGQTCATIFNARQLSKNTTDPNKKVNLLGVYVQVKIIISNKIEDFAGRITVSSNFQNKIKMSDFTASNEFNRTLEDLSRKVVIPNENHDVRHWFYERLRGQYDERKKSLRTKYDRDMFEAEYPSDLKFSKEDVAKVWCSWAGMPNDAVKGATTTYTTFMKRIKEICPVPDEKFYKELIAKIIIYRFLKKRPENKSYGNGKATVMAYALAMLRELSFDKFDLMKVWDAQGLSDNVMHFLNSLSDQIYQYLYSKSQRQNTTILSYGKTKDVLGDLLKHSWNVDRSLLQ